MAEIKLDGVTKEYPGGVLAVDDVSLTIASGEFMVLVGPSGCGKSTLLRMIAGLEEITEGDVSIGDRVVTNLSPRDRDIAMVFQNYALYPHLSVAKNLGYGLRMRKTPEGRDRPARERGRRDARPRGAARAPPGGALGRPAPARRDGPRDRPRAAGVPDGRAALEPRREAPRRHARRARAPPRPARRHDRLRHPRPGRGDDARPARRGHVATGRSSRSTGRRRSTATRRTSSSRRSSARRR